MMVDVGMNYSEALEFTRKIRNQELHVGGHIPIIAMLTNRNEADRKTHINARLDDYLAKPFTLEQFGSMIQAWIEKSQKSQ